MRTALYILTVGVVMALAFWAYRENYATQEALDRQTKVQNEIAALRDNLGVLRAEWAYLNRPARLRELVDLNFERLLLIPVQSGQFAGTRNVDYPAPEAAPAAADPEATTDSGAADPDAPPAADRPRPAPRERKP